MKQYEECPKCGNKQLIVDVEDVIRSKYSAKTGKLIKKNGWIHTNSWNYVCRCGWYSEPATHHDSLPNIVEKRRELGI